MKIVLFCSGGYSTSLLVKKMEKVAQDSNIKLEVSAHGIGEIDRYSEGADLVLLGPQIRFKLAKIKADLSPIPVEVIDMKSYAIADGEAVLKQALKYLPSDN